MSQPSQAACRCLPAVAFLQVWHGWDLRLVTGFQPWDALSRGPGTDPESCPYRSSPSPAPHASYLDACFSFHSTSLCCRVPARRTQTSSKTNSRNTITRAAQEAFQLGHMTHSSKQKKLCGRTHLSLASPSPAICARGTTGTERGAPLSP